MSVRGVSGHTRVAIEHGWEVAHTPPGQLADPRELDRVAWWPAKVPGTIAGALANAGGGADAWRDFDAEDVWWRAPLGTELNAGCVLGFDGIATLWDAWIDGAHVASADSMWARRELRIEHPAKELVIRCRALTRELAQKRPRPRWKVPMLAQQQLRWFRTTLLGRTPGWSPPCPPVGPWRPVWLEQRTHAVGDVRVVARVDGATGVLEVVAELPDADEAEVIVTRGAQRSAGALVRGEAWRGRAVVPEVARWWPHTHGEPARYAVKLAVRGRTGAFEVDLGHVGFRELEVADDFAVRVNGRDVFCRGACWTPLDARTLSAPPAAYDAAVAQLCDAGMNMLRIGGTMTYEADALHDALDARGVLLWQDLMFANMDYPEDPAFVATVRDEVDAEVARLAARPSLAILCGNSEGEQQAAMWGADRATWAPALFHAVLPDVVRARAGEVKYVPSSAHGGAFPHVSNVGPSSYYGVGAYRRPLEDARRAEVVFASECLAFANIPHATGLPGDGVRVHHAAWKARAPRDLGAGWDFDDVRDHYVQLLFGVDPAALRATDHARYLELGRHATGEAMARTFGEWRRARPPSVGARETGATVTRGGLVWFLRDLWPGAGWGLVDAHGRPKPCWYALRRVLAPRALWFTDEGTNGLALHIADETPTPLPATLELSLWRDGATAVGSGSLALPAARSHTLNPSALLPHFHDLSYAYRFGPPGISVIHARLTGAFAPLDAFWFPAGLPTAREPDVGLSATRTADSLTISATRFAAFISIDLPGHLPSDDAFHLAPHQSRTVALRATSAPAGPAGPAAPAAGRGTLSALNSLATAPL